MNISRENYEVYFIDYFDGALSAEKSAELMLFLESNTDLKEEFESFSAVSIDIPEVEFPLRDALKRGEINEQNFSWYMTASIEGDLSSSDQAMLNNYISNHPHLSKDVELFRVAKLDAGSEIYPDKKSLKQPIPFVFNFSRTITYAVAAMLLLSFIAGGYFIFTKSQNQNGGGVAEIPVENSVETPSVIDTLNQNEKIVAPTELKNVVSEKEKLADVVSNKKQVKKTDEKKTKVQEQKNQPELIEQIEPQVAEVPYEKPEQEETLAVVEKTSEQKKAIAPANDDDEYVSVWEAIRNGAENNLRKAVAKESDVAFAENTDEKPLRILDVVSKGVGKISNDKVTVDAAYADNGKVSGFRFAAGKFSIEKN